MAESFNYISFGNWDCVEGDVDVVTMDRGRMFEYTAPDTGKRLQKLDSKKLFRNAFGMIGYGLGSRGKT